MTVTVSNVAFLLLILVKEMATQSTTLDWKIPWMEKPGVGYSPWGCRESDTTKQLHFHSF